MVLGVIGGAPSGVDSVATFTRMVPDGVPWMVTAIGRENFPIMAVTSRSAATSARGSRTSSTRPRGAMHRATRSSCSAR